MNLDYETLRLLFWVLLLLCLIGFALSEGLLLGVCMLLNISSKTLDEKQTLIDSIARVSLGLQTWLVVLVSVLFAAWPGVYAALFASFQSVLLIMLVAWFARPLGLYFRSASNNLQWLQNWDKMLNLGGYIITVMLGIICGNLLKGVPFHLDSDMRIIYLGDLWGLLNPFSLLIAAVSVTVFSLYGATYLQLQTSGQIYLASKSTVFKAGIAFIFLFALAGLWITRLEGYHITSVISPNGVSNPLNKFVKRSEGLWLDNYEHIPSLWAIPALVFICAGLTLYFSRLDRCYQAFLAASVTVVFMVITVGISMFPFLLPSNRSLNSSLTIWDASASQNTLAILLWVLAASLPLMAIVSRWSFIVWQEKSRVD